MRHAGRLLRSVAALALGAWMVALGVAAVKLDAWNDDLVNTLLQIRADATLRERMALQGEAIPREWYRSKALTLLAAAERLQEETVWTLFIPGSWRVFDTLKERVGLRIERAFSEIAVETMRREVHFVASQITGVPLDGGTAELQAVRDCVRPPLMAHSGPLESPEFAAARDYLARVGQLDQALQAMTALQGPGPADSEDLRLLVRYTLGAELPGRLARSTGFVRRGFRPTEAAHAALGTARLQQAARCSLGKAMSALDARLFERNELLATEVFLAQRTQLLFAPGARPGTPGETLQALRELVLALDHQQVLLAHTDYAWMHSGAPSLGPAHEKLLAGAAAIPLLLGPEAVDQVRRQSDQALLRFRGQFVATFRNGGEPSLVWAPGNGRLVLSPERAALRDGLVALLREPFMVPAGDGGFPVGEASLVSWDTQRLEQAVAMGQVRRRVVAEGLPKFPPALRGAVARIVDAQLAQLVQDRIIEAMSPLGPAEPPTAIDAAAFRAQREQLARARTLLAELGARHSAERLRTLLAGDVQGRLTLAEEAMRRSLLYSELAVDFGWWQGEGSPLLQAFAVADVPAMRQALMEQFASLDELGRQVAPLLAHADAPAASGQALARWQGIVSELERYRAARADSSLATLERYLIALGPELNRWNCGEKLAALAPPRGTDEFAQRHAQIHRALVKRCAELRAAEVKVPGSISESRA
ncbi:hypothetical protein [Caenimonas soli]|uniref:hypothetical protein n=1 Tax=Caenimonas soli TaxID=2735555 RepID=UPI001553E13D|nr:hypothetical protein [Caenimonas soli]NPC57238.1 hypothetical protein [Caenimonas soli]